MTQQCISHIAPTLTGLVKAYTPCQGVVWSQYSLPGTFYVPLSFGVVLFAKVCFLQYSFQIEKLMILHWLYCTQTLSYNIS